MPRRRSTDNICEKQGYWQKKEGLLPSCRDQPTTGRDKTLTVKSRPQLASEKGDLVPTLLVFCLFVFF